MKETREENREKTTKSRGGDIYVNIRYKKVIADKELLT
jgi:hypothetical protein